MSFKFRKNLLLIIFISYGYLCVQCLARIADSAVNELEEGGYGRTTLNEQEHSDRGNCSAQVEDSNICITKDCTLTAAMLITAMDTSFDPCDNFYDFACANFIRNQPESEDLNRISAFEEFNRHFDVQLKNLVEGMGSTSDSNVLYRTQELYHVCINTTYQPEKELLAFKNFTQNTLHWPFATGKDWQPKLETLTDYVVLYEASGFRNTLALIFVYPHHDEPSYHIRIDNIGHGNIIDERTLSEMEFFKAMLHLLGNDDQETINEDLEDIKQFIQKLKELNDFNQLDNLSESPTANTTTPVSLTFEQLYELTEGEIDWLRIVNAMMRNKHVFTEQDNVTIDNPMAFKRDIAEYIKLPLRTLVNIMGWRILDTDTLMNAGPDIEALLLQQIQKSMEVNPHSFGLMVIETLKKPRWKKCLEQVNQIFMLGITRLFLEKYIDRTEKGSVDEMIQLIQQGYIQRINQTEWLDEKTKYSAIKKAKAIQRRIGYPDFIFDDVQLEKYYENTLPKIHSTYFENFINHYINSAVPVLLHFADETEPEFEEWNTNPLIVNAFFRQDDNTIWFPSGILQLPFFQDKRLAALNFGMIGSVSGHELGHAFDDTGSQFDENGQMEIWWTNDTQSVFGEKLKCFEEQYNTFCPEFLQGEERICVKGSRTLGENLADHTGLNAAFVAYKMWVEKHGPEKRLPGLQEFSPEQLFFIGNAYLYCEKVPADKWLDQFQYDPHSPGRYRILGSFSNNVFFREAFNCPRGPMNRGNDSCTMW